MNLFRAKLLRTSQTSSARKAKTKIRSVVKDIFGWRVENEKIFRPYFLDYFIPEIMVGIEIDGGVHIARGTYDLARDAYLESRYGVRVYRFDNDEITGKQFREAMWGICISAINDRTQRKGVGYSLTVQTRTDA